uniref:Aspartyl/asparaginy/proline hydroxylase domain-containing protein n=1 Tax=Heterosigma akashiwo TaxID=2829 RepID=A0A7S3UYA1_HETAK
MKFTLILAGILALSVPVQVYSFVSRPFVRDSTTIGLNAFQMSLQNRINTVVDKQWGKKKVGKVLDAFNRIAKGDIWEMPWGEKSKQVAHSYMEGLTVKDYWDVDDFQWAIKLQDNWEQIRDELQNHIQAPTELEQKGNNIWSAALTSDAQAYGQDWKTLVLMDRGVWDPTNSGLFPQTVEVLKKCGVPCCEAFFAKQPADTGIKPHSDGTNFIITSHLALMTPKDKAWIEVGGKRAYWEEGKVLIFDTSLLHNTRNDGDIDRYVLMLRFWHPDMTKQERQAMQFIFNCIDDPELVDMAEAELAQGGGKKKKKSVKKLTASGGGGFS